jgi:hypothetical protein
MTGPHTPQVSVLVTAHDNERHIAIAVASVLQQTNGDLELLVVDDGSRDGTPGILESLRDPRLTVIRHETSAGTSTRRNELVERARGRFVAPLDADDAWVPQRLEAHVAFLDANPDLVAVGSDLLTIDDRSRACNYLRLPRSDTAIRWFCLFTSPAIHSAVTVRKSAFDGGVRYDPAFPLTQDFDLWTKLLRMGRACNMGRPLSLYRVHPGQATAKRASEQRREQQEIGCREIETLLGPYEPAQLAWAIGAGAPVGPSELGDAVDAYFEVFAQFERQHADARGMGEARRIAATALLRRAGMSRTRAAWTLRRAALRIDPGVPLKAASVRVSNLAAGRRYRPGIERALAGLTAN